MIELANEKSLPRLNEPMNTIVNEIANFIIKH